MTRETVVARFLTPRMLTVGGLVLLAVGVLFVALQQYVLPTRVVLVNYPDFTSARIKKETAAQWVEVDIVGLGELKRARRAGLVLVFGRGLSLDPDQQEAFRKISRRGTAVYVEAPTDPNADMTSLSGETLTRVRDYLAYGGSVNYRNLLAYARRHIDGKRIAAPAPGQPEPIPSDVLFSASGDAVFESVAAFEAEYRRAGTWRPEGRSLALLTSVPGPFNANRDHLNAIIEAFETRGFNVYPIASANRRLAFLQEISPDAVIYMPHGALTPGQCDQAITWLEENRIPLFTPLSLFTRHDDWIDDPQGFSGPLLTMNLVLAELDGGIDPFATVAQYPDADGLATFRAIPDRLERFVTRVERHLALNDLANADKRLAIFFFKGPGEGAMNAGGLEVAPSLHRFLLRLRDAGYDLGELPEDAAVFEDRVMATAPVLAPYAAGDMARWLGSGAPAWIDTPTYEAWCREQLGERNCARIDEKYGVAPGSYLVAPDGSKLAVARIEFGKVVLLPQPLPAVGEDSFRLVHGAGVAPPHPYAGAYLWSNKGFGADAIIHFGTHGSLEFTPGKQVALSSHDWSDVLIGDAPHFYVYTMNNVGEAIIAKRRSYATILSHLTQPIGEAGLTGDLAALRNELDGWRRAEGATKVERAKDIRAVAERLDLLTALELPAEEAWTGDHFLALANFVERQETTRITLGLYSLGKGYSQGDARETAIQMTVAPLAEALLQLDRMLGVDVAAAEADESLFRARYRDPARRAVENVLDGGVAEAEISGLIELPKHMRTDELDQELAHSPAEPEKRERHTAEQGRCEAEECRILDVVERIEGLLIAAPDRLQAIVASGNRELAAALDALGGAYIAPSPGGDPVVAPAALPTGRNLVSIDAERTPSAAAWRVGEKLANDLIEHYRDRHGSYPDKVAMTLWPNEFIQNEGSMVAQILHLIGAEPVRDRFGRVADVRLTPASSLQRPRIDVVVQTAGQLRDLAASRLVLINKAASLAAAEGNNPVAQSAERVERTLLADGLSPLEARALSTERVFGGVNGNYGTGIMGFVEDGDRWNDAREIGRQYLVNMNARYGSSDDWGANTPGLFAAVLQDTDAIVQPRESNVNGPVSLDHVYEFMGGLSRAAETVTGRAPDAYFNDYRTPGAAEVRTLEDSVAEELHATLLNPTYIKALQAGGASSAAVFAESFRNGFGWETMRPETIGDETWNALYDVYVEDRHNLDLRGFFATAHPQSLQEMTAVMLETIRKGFWSASDEQRAALASMHADLIEVHGAGCSEFVCGNPALRQFISASLSAAAAQRYASDLDAAVSNPDATASLVLTERRDASGNAAEPTEPRQQPSPSAIERDTAPADRVNALWMLAGILIALAVGGMLLVPRALRRAHS